MLRGLEMDKDLKIIYRVWIFAVASLMIFPLIFASPSLTDNLVSYYKLDEIAGTTASDERGYQDGTANNERVFTTEVTGIINTGADFSQGSDFIELDDAPWDDVFSGDFSVSVWVYNISSTGITGGIVSKWYDGSTRVFKIYVVDNQLRVQVEKSGTTETMNTGVYLNTPDWRHIVMVKNSSGYKIYVNNTLVGSSSTTWATTNEEDLNIGRDKHFNEYITGAVDEIGIWNRSLTPAEISELYGDGTPPSYPFVADTCTCPGLNQDWEIDMSDYCNITSDCNLGTGTLSFTGSGYVNCNATINTINMGSPPNNSVLYVQDSCLIVIN